jgi:hypothetical protein
MMKRKIFFVVVLTTITAQGFGARREKPPAQVEYLPPQAASAKVASSKVDSLKLLPSNDFTGETLGAEPSSFAPAVGFWLIGTDGDNKVLVVDGRKWEEGQSSAGIAEKARAIYGERYAEFLDNVKAYAYFPFAVAKYVDDFNKGEISLRFKPIAGKVDQAAGILFNVKPNGDYLTLRANALEENLVLFKYVKGKRSSVKWIKNVPTPSKKWQDLRLVVQGKEVKGYLIGTLYLEHTLPEPVSGKVGVWTKADSVTYFDDFTVKPGKAQPAG